MKRHTNKGKAALKILLVGLAFSTFIFPQLYAGPSTSISAEDQAFVDFIAELSIVERDRSGIPACITAAQAILESSWGRGRLATEGNNYFGIKCKKNWLGASVMHKDDDYDKKGRLTESCFRAYDDVADSFRDHSDFLTSRDRYAKLFEIHPEDYKSWAHGLRKCGYATDEAYGNKLISIIERLELFVLDWPGNHYEKRMAERKLLKEKSALPTQTIVSQVPSEYEEVSEGTVVERPVLTNPDK